MYIPAVRERVAVAGRSGVFIVVRVDHNAELVDLVALVGTSFLEEDVPFSAIHPFAETHRDAG